MSSTLANTLSRLVKLGLTQKPNNENEVGRFGKYLFNEPPTAEKADEIKTGKDAL